MTRLSRSDLKGRSQTFLGLIDPAQLGSTLMHEHIICDITPPKLAATGVEGDEIDICNCWQINYGQKTSALKYNLKAEHALIPSLANRSAVSRPSAACSAAARTDTP